MSLATYQAALIAAAFLSLLAARPTLRPQRARAQAGECMRIVRRRP